MTYDSLYEELIFTTFNPKIDQQKKDKVKFFLQEEELKFPDTIEFTVIVTHKQEIIATGSLEKDVLKCFSINKKFRNRGLTNEIVKILTEEAFKNNNTHLFVYTKPSNVKLFEGVGYHKLTEISNLVALLENKTNGFKKYLKSLEKYKVSGKIISSIVMNCNPFTKGHLFLVEKAAKESDIVHVFVVTENRSEFNIKDRITMVKLGVCHLDNVIVHLSGKYIISNATFPSYFIKDQKQVAKAHDYLDLTLFGEYIVKSLNITNRYVGEEPLCIVTKSYNTCMKELLPKYGVKVIEVPRLEINNKVISASRVRKLLAENKLDELKDLVPKTTFDYLLKLNKI